MIQAEPFQGFEAVFAETLSASGRVRVLLSYLGRQMSCEVAIDDLTKFEFRNSNCEIDG